MEPIDQAVDSVQEHPWIFGVLPHLLTVIGVLLAVFAIARLISERRQPSNTFAWLLAIVFVPYVGVPLYLMLGGRKIRRLVAHKRQIPTHAADLPPSPAAAVATARVLMQNGGSPPVGGNRLRLLTTGEQAFAELERQILEARHTIHVMTFILGRDEVGRRIVELLAQRAREGVKVRLLLDSLGCFLISHRFIAPILRAGGEVHRFMPVLPLQTRGSANLRNHRKIAVFDHTSAFLGGHNLAIEYMGPAARKKRWRDFGAIIEGPAVCMLNAIFAADWAYAGKVPVKPLLCAHDTYLASFPGQSEVQVVASGPDVQGDSLYEGILSMVEVAERSIWIVTPYFVPDEVLFRMLLVKARSGVEIRLVVPARSNHPITDVARRHYLRELRAAGAQVLLYQPGMNHAKVILTDESVGLIGSANLDQRSLFVNFEVGVLTYSKPDAAAIGTWMQEVFEQCRPMPAPPKHRRFHSAVAEEVSRLLAPML